MRVFDHPNTELSFECPVCKTGKDKPVVLVPMPGTEKDGNVQCAQVHVECIKLWYKMRGLKLELEYDEKTMTQERFNHLQKGGALKAMKNPLLPSEFDQGYHYCVDWDGLFIGPESPEWESCTCHPLKRRVSND